MTGSSSALSAVDTWRQVIALLVAAADRGYDDARSDPTVHSTALWADGLASTAISLLPAEDDYQLEDVVLDDATADLDMGGLIRAAEAATRTYPVELFPAGASSVVVGLCDLAAELSR